MERSECHLPLSGYVGAPLLVSRQIFRSLRINSWSGLSLLQITTHIQTWSLTSQIVGNTIIKIENRACPLQTLVGVIPIYRLFILHILCAMLFVTWSIIFPGNASHGQELCGACVTSDFTAQIKAQVPSTDIFLERWTPNHNIHCSNVKEKTACGR